MQYELTILNHCSGVEKGKKKYITYNTSPKVKKKYFEIHLKHSSVFLN